MSFEICNLKAPNITAGNGLGDINKPFSTIIIIIISNDRKSNRRNEVAAVTKVFEILY